MTAFEYLKSLPYLPVSLQRGKGKEIYGRPSNSEIRRWLVNKSVRINGMNPLPEDQIFFPIIELIFFPTGRTCTMIKEDSEKKDE